MGRPRRKGLPSDKSAQHEIADNVLDRQFVAAVPNQKWVADFTYLWTAEGWFYVAAVIDLSIHSKDAFRGWRWPSTPGLVRPLAGRRLPRRLTRRCGQRTQALRRPVEPKQCSCEQFQKLLVDHGISCNMSRSYNV